MVKNKVSSINEVEIKEVIQVLQKVNEFITNGVEYGYIQLPVNTPTDPANTTPSLVKELLNKWEYALNDE